MKSKQKNPRGGCGNRKTDEKTQNRELNQESEEQSGCSEWKVSRKTHAVGLEVEKQAKKPKPEAIT